MTKLPAGPRHPGLTAGPSFQFFRSTQLLPSQKPAWQILRERLEGLAAYCDVLVREGLQELGATGEVLQEISRSLTPANSGGLTGELFH